jgi:MoxR-like ATPase
MAEVQRVIVGLERPLFLVAVSLAAGGNILAKAKPGTAKSTLAKCAAAACALKTVRLQGTADTRPAKITGYSVETAAGREFRPSPLLGGQLIHFDEFDRLNPESQVAALEAMAEGQITVEGKTYRLEDIFMVVATINGTESEGTFPIGNATADRFMFFITWPQLAREQLIRLNKNEILRSKKHPEDVLGKVTALEDIQRWRDDTISMVGNAEDAVLEYIAQLSCCLDPERQEFGCVKRAGGEGFAGLISWGGAERCNLFLLRASAAVALFTGSDKIHPHHVRFIFPDAARPHFRMASRARYDRDPETQDSFIQAVLRAVQPA